MLIITAGFPGGLLEYVLPFSDFFHLFSMSMASDCDAMKTGKKNGLVAAADPLSIVGGVSAAVSKTAAAPIERVKLLIQNQVCPLCVPHHHLSLANTLNRMRC